MTEHAKVRLTLLSSGIPNLDSLLGGGFPEYSCNLIAGDPGSGKTTLCHQVIFANATPDRTALYFTIMGEPPLKMLRYQQQFSFFEPDKLDRAIFFRNVSQEVLDNLESTLAEIVAEVDRRQPAFVVVDSFRTLVQSLPPGTANGLDMQLFLQRLALALTSRQVTSFLVGEYGANDTRDYPLFTMADGILWLTQSVHRNSMVRKIQVLKMRGVETQPGLHTFRLTSDGVTVYPRMVKPVERPSESGDARGFLSTGVTGLDEMLGGGFYPGSAILVAGPSGSGKSSLALQFLAEGVQRGEPGVLAMFEETPIKYIEQARGFGFDVDEMVRRKLLKLIYLRPLDLSVDETLHEIQTGIVEVKAMRVVIDSLTGLEIALAPTFEEDFRESLYRLIGALTGANISIMMTAENNDSYTELRFSPHAVSFMTNDIILQRYVEIDSRLRRMMTVVKARSRQHPADLREYEITDRGLVVGARFAEYAGLLTGVPRPRQSEERPGLTAHEAAVLAILTAAGEADQRTLTEKSGLRNAIVSRALRRLVDLGYADKMGEGSQTMYRSTPK